MPHSARVPTRTCIGCRAICPAAELVRLTLVSASGTVQLARTSAGRGAWLHPRADCARAAIKARAFSRAFRKSVVSQSTDNLIAALEAAAHPRRP